MTDFAELRGDDVAYQTYRRVAPIIRPDLTGSATNEGRHDGYHPTP